MSRRAHPYYGFIDRRRDLKPPGSGRRSDTEPLLRPEDQPGLLWELFRAERTSWPTFAAERPREERVLD